MARSKIMKNLSVDLLIEILLRLPIKSLLRFRLVSKSWLRQISGPQFKRKYGETSTCRPRLMIFPWGGAPITTCPFRPKLSEHPCTEILAKPFDSTLGTRNDPVQLVGSCNGLVCLVYRRTNSVVVWNPATRKYRRVPATSSYKWFVCHGFGYDASTDDHKVVEYSCTFGRRRRFCCSVYSLRNSSWKTLDWPHAPSQRRRGVFLQGAIHWMVPRDDSAADLIAVNMTTEEYSRVPLPADGSVRKPMESGLLGVSRGRLCLCFRNDDKRWDVWVMQEYGVKESWTEEAYIPYYFCAAKLGDLQTEALCFTEKGGVLVALASECKSESEFNRLRQLTSRVPDKATIYAESFVDP